MRPLLIRLASLFRRTRLDARLDDEVQFHVDMLAQEHRRRGMSERDARAAALRSFGGVIQMKEAHREQRSLPLVEPFIQDARYALRAFRRAPALTLAALLTLAIGIGATTAIFSVVNAILLRQLPYPSPGELVVFGDGTGRSPYSTLGYATFADYRDRTRAFSHLAAIRSWQPTLVTSEAERLSGMRVSWNYFSLLGVQPALGRTFLREEDHPDRHRVVVLSDGLWRRRFHADASVIGQTIRMNDLTYEIIGVMPPRFEDVISASAYRPAELWSALGYDVSQPFACRSCQHLRAVGRMRPGITVAQASDDLAAIRAGLMQQFPTQYGPGRAAVRPLQDAVSGSVRQPLFVLLGAVALVLLIACANVANLLLARAMSRSREMAVRAALGAGRSRLVRQMVTESTMLWIVGGAAGVAVAFLLLRLLATIAPGDLPRSSVIAIDLPVLAFSAVLSVLTGLLFGLLPALGATSGRLSGALSSGARGSVGTTSRRLRQTLVVMDLAVALVLLAGAGLMLKSVASLLDVDPGFSSARVLTAQFSLIGQAYRDNAAVYGFIKRLNERVRALPGVEAAAIAGQIPMGGNGDRFGIYLEGQSTNPVESPALERYSVTHEYFRVMQIPLVRGRLIGPQDTPSSQPVMLISETAANTLFPGRDPLGRRVRVGGAPDAPWRTIVGVVGDVRHAELTEEVRPQMYLPQSQFTDSFLVLAVKTSSDAPSALLTEIRAVLREQDPAVPLYQVAALDHLVARTMAGRRFVMVLLVGFAAISLLLAAIGLYGVVSYTVAERTREVGLRVALGATRADVFRLVLGSGLGTIAAGIVVGAGAAAIATGFLEGQLYGVEPVDPGTFAAAAALLCGVALAAHVLPIRRALAVDPTTALRED